ncbi:hypothetical protein Hgul01_04754 [Herpetosiphon gulosus]|uniref:Uncharacterized protein n=1 Tax=Herpetosiphon gulosus TaxID=1973496 RepID=A0ABP9X6B0_9CHLR
MREEAKSLILKSVGICGKKDEDYELLLFHPSSLSLCSMFLLRVNRDWLKRALARLNRQDANRWFRGESLDRRVSS